MRPCWVGWIGCVTLLSGVLVSMCATADERLEGFLDGYLGSVVVQSQSAGATVAVVQNNKLLANRGYGWADIANQRRVDGASTLFRVGSITKVLVWISVLQQVDAGRLDLDADITEYLHDVVIADNWPEPITLRHLMTHTPGFADRLYGLFQRSPSTQTLAQSLAERVPRRLWMPGTMIAYSNYGAGLAARIVENSSRVPWDSYVEQHIFAPLEMNSSTTRQPIPPALRDRFALGYERRDGRFEVRGFEYTSPSPAGSMSTTAADMAKLMNALLNPVDDSLLSAAGKRALLTRTPSPGDPLGTGPLGGLTLGMYSMTDAGRSAVGHGGDTMLFHARMVLWPEQSLGLFVAMNTASSGPQVDTLMQSLAQRYELRKPNEFQPAGFEAEKYLGAYAVSRNEADGVMKFLKLFQRVAVTFDDNTQQLLLRFAGDVLRVAAVQDPNQTHLFFAPGEHRRIAFFEDNHGDIAGFRLGAFPVVTLVRTAWFEHPWVNLGFLLTWLVVNAAGLVLWPLTMLKRRRGAGRQGNPGATFVGWLAALVAVGAFIWFVQLFESQVSFMLGNHLQLKSWVWFSVILAPLGLVQLVFAYGVWTQGTWWLARRMHYSLAAILNILMLVWCFLWNVHPLGVS